MKTVEVSVIVVTLNRERFLPAIYHCYARQGIENTEMLVLDDSPEPSPFFSRLQDPRVHYRHLDRQLSIGAKRNMLVQQARGRWICHFDDDDYYAENYLQAMLAHAGSRDFVKLTGWYNYSPATGALTYLDTTEKASMRYEQTGRRLRKAGRLAMRHGPGQRRWIYGYGFSYCYKRELGLRYPFPNVNYGEDYPMARACARASGGIRLVRDEAGLVLHQLHGKNTSTVSPQYRLPAFLLRRLFPGYEAYARRLQGGWPAIAAAKTPPPARPGAGVQALAGLAD